MKISCVLGKKPYYTLKTGIPVEEGDSILKLLRRVSCPDIHWYPWGTVNDMVNIEKNISIECGFPSVTHVIGILRIH